MASATSRLALINGSAILWDIIIRGAEREGYGGQTIKVIEVGC